MLRRLGAGDLEVHVVLVALPFCVLRCKLVLTSSYGGYLARGDRAEGNERENGVFHGGFQPELDGEIVPPSYTSYVLPLSSIAATLVLGQSRFREENALRTVLANDAVIFVQQAPSPFVSLQLIVSNANSPDTPATYGYRHLMEHIIARSVPGHDVMIETGGGALDAATTRDTVKFEWRVPVALIPSVLSTMRKFLDWKTVTKEEIARESAIIGHELALQDSVSRSSAEAWNRVFEDQGMSMMGDEGSCAKATPEQLTAIWKRLTVGNQIVVSVSGPVDKVEITKQIRPQLEGLPKGESKVWQSRSVSGSYGTKQLAAIVVPPIGSPGSISALVAAFGASARLSRPFFTYTVSARPSVALLGSLDAAEEIAKVLKDEDPASAFRIGKAYMYAWIRGEISSPSKSASFYGVLLSAGLSQRPSKLWEQVEYADYQQFLNYWRQIQAVAR